MKCNDEKSAILVCGREVNRVREVDIQPDFTLNEPIVLARVEVDLENLIKPVISLDFSTFIQVIDGLTTDPDAVGVELDFRLKKICNGREEVLKNYQFNRLVIVGDGDLNTRDSFKFIFCDDFICSKDCCVYIVELVSIELIGPGAATENIEELVIEDSSIRAIVQETCSKGIALSCGREVRRFREIDTGSLNLAANPIVLAMVEANTASFKNPLVKIDFSTFIQVIIPSDVNTVGAAFNLELKRNCNGVKETLRNYRYVVDFRGEDNRSRGFNVRDTFGFTYCDSDLLCQEECCIYTVELTRVDVTIFGPVNPANELIIEDSSIRAIAQERTKCKGGIHCERT